MANAGPVLVVNFGTKDAYALARHIREASVFSQIVPNWTSPEDMLALQPAAVVFPNEQLASEHGTAVSAAGVKVLSEGESLAAFLEEAAGQLPVWSPATIVASEIEKIKAQVGDARAVCGLSGGVDSAVSAAIVHKAIGDKLTCVFVNTGLMRSGEPEQVEKDFVAATGAELVMVDAVDTFLGALKGVRDPEEKRKIIGREFIRVFEEAARGIVEQAGEKGEEVKFLVQGTIYPDVVESVTAQGEVVKSHHNVGGLPDDLDFGLVEPLRELFKDEVRQVGLEIGLPEHMVWRQPFPGPGLGVRVVGELTRENLDTLRAADKIVRERLTAAGLDEVIWQCPVVLLADVRAVGLDGESRTYGHPVVLRPIVTDNAITAEWVRVPFEVLDEISQAITREVAGVNRVVLDITNKPPATIEWE